MEKLYLNIGDEETLVRLRMQCTEWPRGVEKAYYWTIEQILWRMSLNAGR